jgi:hypothetical protein
LLPNRTNSVTITDRHSFPRVEKFPEFADRKFISVEEERRFEQFLDKKTTASMLHYKTMYNGEEILHTAVFFT